MTSDGPDRWLALLDHLTPTCPTCPTCPTFDWTGYSLSSCLVEALNFADARLRARAVVIPPVSDADSSVGVSG
jgi:hypothetical protein